MPNKTTGRINIKISRRAYKKLSALAGREGRTILATVDNLLTA
jgi:hypothetical protein